MRHKTTFAKALSCLSIFLLLGCLAAEIRAATFTVNQSDDAGDGTCDATCTLRDAVDDANNLASHDTIDFAAGIINITLSDEIVIANNGTMTISGSGAPVLTVDGGPGLNRIFYTSGANVIISGLTLTDGNGAGANDSGAGGAIYVFGGRLTLNDVLLSGNSASGSGGAIWGGFGPVVSLDRVSLAGNSAGGSGGGASFNGGLYRIINSTINGNSANDGGGINFHDTFFDRGSLSIVNSTITSNTVTGNGGGLRIDRFNSIVHAVLFNTTVSNNTANTGGGIDVNDGRLDFGNTIIAGNSATFRPEIRNFASVLSLGNNLVGDSPGDSTDTTSPINYQPTDIRDINPMLGFLAFNGGPTQTHALLADSPAIDSGSNDLLNEPLAGNPPFDQRGTGFPRILDGNADGTATVDIGSFELIPPLGTLTVNLSDDSGDGFCDATCTLRDAVTTANNDTDDNTIIFEPALANVTLTDEIVIAQSVSSGTLTINGPGADLLTIDGGAGTNRIFYSNATIVTVSGVTLTGGNGTGASSSGFGGVMYVFAGSLTLDGVHITGNSSSNNAGGVYFFTATSRIVNSTISANSSPNCGGFWSDAGGTPGTLTIANSTISGNTATVNNGGGFCNNANTTLRNVTVTNNTAGFIGGGTFQNGGSLNLGNTILAANTASDFPEIFSGGGTVSVGNNLVGDAKGDSTATNQVIGYQMSDITDVAPMLGPLQDNGGPTLTHALLTMSPAIDAGNDALAVDPFDNSPLTTDQRGEGFARILSTSVDIGAFEFATLTPGIDVTPTVVNFGNQVVGTTSAPLNITVTNTGTADLVLGTPTFASGTEFAFTSDPNGTVIAPQGMAVISFIFSPTSTGAKNDTVSIISNASGSPPAVSLTATGIANPISPSNHDFGEVALGSPSGSQIFTITNNFGPDWTITGINKSGSGAGDFAVDTSNFPAVIPNGGTATFGVVFTPSTRGLRNATLTLVHDRGETISATVTGTGVGPVINVIPGGATDFGNQTVGTTSGGTTITVQNNGDSGQDLVLSSVTIVGGNSGDFAIVGNPSPSSIPSGGQIQFSVSFGPTASGARTATLDIASNDPVNPNVTRTLNGTGISPPLTLTVNQSGDAGDGTCDATCTLRDAVDDANNSSGDDTINFDAALTTITLDNAEVVISDNGSLTINGPGANVLTIAGGPGTNRIFYIDSADVSVSDVTLTGGDGEGSNFSGQGGAIYVSNGSLWIDRVHVIGNITGGAGGGIYFDGGSTSRITNSTLSGNTALADGGGFAADGTPTIVVNSTISGNHAGNSGGGFAGLLASVQLRNVTITNNEAQNQNALGGGGGLSNICGSVNFGNTVIAGNISLQSPEIYWSTDLCFTGSMFTAGNNHVGDSAGDSTATNQPITYQTSDIQNIDPMLRPLQDNGGPTPTHALLTMSPAIDAGNDALAVDPFNNSPLTNDQRGAGFARILSTSVDIGAFEFATPTAADVSVSGRVVSGGGNGVPRALVTITGMDGTARTALTNPFGYFRFDDVRAGETYLVSVVSKLYQFEPQVVTVNDNVDDLIFTGLPPDTPSGPERDTFNRKMSEK